MNPIARSFVALVALCSVAIAQVPGKAGEEATKKPLFATVESYPLSICVVTGKPLEAGKRTSTKIEDRIYITCCQECVKKSRPSRTSSARSSTRP